MKLFCFPYAGGNAAFFEPLEQCLRPAVEVVKLEYAGHGARHRENFYESFSALAEDMYCSIKSLYRSGEKYALMGYSMGSISVVEVLKKILEADEIACPIHLFLAAHEPQTKKELMGYSDTTKDEWIKERTIKFGGIPKNLAGNNSFWRVYLPLYRADYTLLWNYDFNDLDLKSDIPVTVFYSQEDTPLQEMQKWQSFFTGECDFAEYSGNHFFIKEHCREMANVISRHLLS